MLLTAGTMSGGGKTVSRGRMGSSVVGDSSVDPKELANMENELEKVTTRKQGFQCVLEFKYNTPWLAWKYFV